MLMNCTAASHSFTGQCLIFHCGGMGRKREEHSVNWTSSEADNKLCVVRFASESRGKDLEEGKL